MSEKQVAHFRQILCRCAVRISGLNDSHIQFSLKSCILHELNDESCDKGCNFISIKHVELAALVIVKVHQAICVTVQATSSLARFENGCQGRGQPLGCFHIVGTA